jgi:hypothetical protein
MTKAISLAAVHAALETQLVIGRRRRIAALSDGEFLVWVPGTGCAK